MDVSAPRTPRSLLALAALALVLLGAALSALTWRNLVQQRALIDQHVLFAARTILRGVETNLMRVMPMLGRIPPEVAQERLEEVFRELAASGEVLFLGLYGPHGELLLSSAPTQSREALSAPLDALALADLALTGEWFGTLPLGGVSMLAYAARTRPGMAQFCPGMRQGLACPPAESAAGSGPPQPGAVSPLAQQPQPRNQAPPGPQPQASPPEQPGPPRAQGRPSAQDLPPVYFLVGLSLDEHYAHYINFRNAALAQTGFVLGSAALLWVLMLAYLRRREQGQKLIRLESFHSKLLDSLPEALLTVDASGQVSAANPAAKTIIGPGLVGAPFDSLPLAQAVQAPDAQACDAPAPDCSWRQLTLDGRNLEVLSLPLGDETMILARDRTRMRSLERDLEQSRHLAAVGRLAAGVAHEIRNPLSALRGFAQFFATKLKGREPEQTYADTMVQEADRLGRVVTDLLYLARPRALEPASMALEPLAQDLQRLMGFDMQRAKAALVLDLQAPTVTADPDGLKQALINLVLNSLAALGPDGGTLTLASRQEDGGVRLSLADTGRGMDEQQRRRALEPFFTTRKEGSGLGLAIVHKIVRDHGASLEIESQPGVGTTVSMVFPLNGETLGRME